MFNINTIDEYIWTTKIDESGNAISCYSANPDYKPHLSIWQRFKNWLFNESDLSLVIRKHDLNNGPDTNGENKPRNTIEIGITGKF